MKQKGFAQIYFLIILLLAGGLGGYYYFTKSSLKSVSVQPVPTITQKPVDETASWKTYQNINPNYYYSLKYPGNIFLYSDEDSLISQSWTNVEGTRLPLTGDDPNRLVLAVQSLKPENMESLILQFYKDSIDSQAKINFNELGITKISDIETDGTKGAVYTQILPQYKTNCFLAVWFKNEKYFELRLCAVNENKLQNQRQLFDQILATFKFLDQNTINNSSWIEELIKKEENQPVANPPTSLSKCTYKNQAVYYQPTRCCDQYANLYDDKGEIICHPDGGLIGKGDGKCRDFSETKNSCVVIWKDKR